MKWDFYYFEKENLTNGLISCVKVENIEMKHLEIKKVLTLLKVRLF